MASLPCLLIRRKLRKSRNRVIGFYDEVVPRYLPDEFRIHFRMTRCTVQVIYEQICRVLRDNPSSKLRIVGHVSGREKISLQHKLTMLLWYMATRETYRELANLFGHTESVCCDTIHAFLALFADHLLPVFVRWPTENEKREISAFFLESRNFPGVIGMIDGCHVPIKRPKENGDVFYNRKDFYSYVLQAVCREDMRFTDVFVGFPGRVHDARIFQSSPLHAHGPEICESYHMLGDSAYPNLEWLLTPNRCSQLLTENMLRYNTVHSSIRTTIERAFAQLKGRFRRTKYIDQDSPVTILNTIITACCLHNVCIVENDVEDDLEEAEGVPVAVLQPGIFDREQVNRGALKRQRIMERLAS